MITKSKVKLLFSLLLALTFLLNGCEDDDPNNVEVVVDQSTCPDVDLKNAVLSITKISYYDYLLDQRRGPYGDGYPIPEILADRLSNCEYVTDEQVLGSATDEVITSYKNRYVEGYEINFGFWSRDSYRRYTFAEMFEWKYGRKPTEEEEKAITDDEVKKWFEERHTVHRPWILGGDDLPRDVNTINPPITKFTFNLSKTPSKFYAWDFTGESKISGEIIFQDGTKCKLVPKTINKYDYDRNKQPHKIMMEIAPGCSMCK